MITGNANEGFYIDDLFLGHGFGITMADEFLIKENRNEFIDFYKKFINPASGVQNLNPEIVNRIAQKSGLRFTNKKDKDIHENASPVCYAASNEVREEFKIEIRPETFEPVDILDYVYAVLHSPTYKGSYQETMRVPYPKDTTIFWQLVKLGKELRQIFLKMDG